MNLETKLTRSSNCIESKIDGHSVILNLDNDNFIKINRSGRYIWELLSCDLKISELLEKITYEHNLSEDNIKKIHLFIKDCIDAEILKIIK